MGPKDEFCYALNDICSNLTIRRLNKDEDKAGLRVMTKILQSDKHLEVHLTKDKELEYFKDIDIPGISSRVKPDLSVYNKAKNAYVAFIEVETETLQSTIRKMYFVLLLQLIKARICDSSISAVTGLVLPTERQNRSAFIAVTVSWNSQSFKFSGTLTRMCKSEVRENVRKVITEQDMLISGLIYPPNMKYYFQDSFSAKEITEYLSKYSVHVTNHECSIFSLEKFHYFW